MADNYLESRYEEVFGSGARKSVIKRTNPSLNTLLVKNRTIRRFRQDIDINAEHLPEERYIDIDLGISLQSMALKAVELGLNCLIKGNLDRDALRAFFKEEDERIIAENGYEVLEPVAVFCVGKSAESVFLKPVIAGEDLTPYTKDGVHYVPKLQSETLTLK